MITIGSSGASGTGPDGAAGPCPRLAVLSTGIMGGATARNLIRAGLPVDVWDRRPEATGRLTEAGATAYVGPDSAVAHADVVITMLPDAATVTSVAIGQGMLAARRQGTIWAQMGTVGVRAAQQLAASVPDQRSDVGGRAGSGEEGERGGGPIGSKTRWLGEAGAGSRLKLVLNTWLPFLMEGIAESVALADMIGVDHPALRDALQGSPVNAPVALLKLAKLDAGDESPDFSLRWVTKDVDLALAEAGTRPCRLPPPSPNRGHTLVEAGLGRPTSVP